MKFDIKPTREKEISIYKTLYIKQTLADQIDVIAREHGTSWNNVVISMIEGCLSSGENERDETNG